MSLTATEKQFAKFVSAILEQHTALREWPAKLKPRKVAYAFGKMASRAELVGDLKTHHAASTLEDTWYAHARAKEEYDRLMQGVRLGLADVTVCRTPTTCEMVGECRCGGRRIEW